MARLQNEIEGPEANLRQLTEIEIDAVVGGGLLGDVLKVVAVAAALYSAVKNGPQV